MCVVSFFFRVYAPLGFSSKERTRVNGVSYCEWKRISFGYLDGVTHVVPVWDIVGFAALGTCFLIFNVDGLCWCSFVGAPARVFRAIRCAVRTSSFRILGQGWEVVAFVFRIIILMLIKWVIF